MSDKILIFRHSLSCPQSLLAVFLTENGIQSYEHSWYLGNSLNKIQILDHENYKGLVILGGPQNVDEDYKYPWLKLERKAIETFLNVNKPVLGICLGGQLIAQILGADVGKHIHTEAGWHSVRLEPSVSPLLPVEKQLNMFQWHSYRFKTPSSAYRFATNSITQDQGFVYKNNVIATQFHPEADLAWIQQCAADSTYPTGPYVQTQKEILLKANSNLEPMKKWFFTVLSNMFLETSS